MKIDNISATCHYVTLQPEIEESEEKEVVSASGVILTSQRKSGTIINNAGKDGKQLVTKFKVLSIGPAVDKEKLGYDIGDIVYVNDYDIQTIGDDEGNEYILIKADQIKAKVTVS